LSNTYVDAIWLPNWGSGFYPQRIAQLWQLQHYEIGAETITFVSTSVAKK